jgi:hypothetical protein
MCLRGELELGVGPQAVPSAGVCSQTRSYAPGPRVTSTARANLEPGLEWLIRAIWARTQSRSARAARGVAAAREGAPIFFRMLAT